MRKRDSSHLSLSRPPLERMLKIHQAIQTGDYPNAPQLAEKLEVSVKSVRRDLDFMKYRLDLPIEFDPVKNGFYYTEEVSAFPSLQISEGELFALLVAEKALQQYRGTPFEKPLVGAFKKMAASLPDTVSLNLAEWEQTISFRTRAVPILNLEIFDKLAQATAQRAQIQIAYRKPAQRECDIRIIDPYHLANVNGEWYLFAYCHLRKDIRTFVPARVHSIERTGVVFPRPENFSLEQRLKDSFGIQSADGQYDVTLRFSQRVADYIREKKWHDSEVRRELEDGGIELSMKLSSLAEIERWILSWAGNATVIHPPALRERIRTAAENLLKSTEPPAPEPPPTTNPTPPPPAPAA